MFGYVDRILAVLISFSIVAANPVSSQPQPVPRLVERALDQASYVKLAKEWKEYIAKKGETAEALVNLGMAYRYCDEEEAAITAGRRAVELEPDNPKALAFLGAMLSVYHGDDDSALEPLERCRRIAPDYEWGLTTLATVYLRRGEWAKSEEIFKTIFEQRIIPQPVQDYAYNMLVGLPEGAVLITGGDSDTFAPLALQAGMKFRNDVIVLNRSLMNLPAYAKAVFIRYPSVKPDYDIDKHVTAITPDGKASLLASRLIERMMAEEKAPLFFAASANYESYGFKPEAHVEGINLRLSGRALSSEESAQLFFHAYRLDSATDWNYAWSLTPSLAGLMGNYATAMFNVVNLAQEKELAEDTRRRLLEKALEIADFHDLERMEIYIEKALRNK